MTSPVSVAVEPTNICNLACPLCATGAGLLDRPRGCMTLSQFKHLVDGLPRTVGTMYLWGQGEPFLTPGLVDMIAYAERRGIRAIVSTNGNCLRDIPGIIASGLTKLIISLDGIDPTMYASYRVGGDFATVVDAVRELVREKHRVGRGPIIELQFLATAESAPAIGSFREFGESLGADRVVCKTLQAAWIPEGEQKLPSDARLTRYRRSHDGALVPDRHTFIGSRCLRLYHSCQIDWQGNVVPCCFDKDSAHILGNVFSSPFKDIWNGGKYREFRALLNHEGRRMDICRDCSEGLKRIYIHV
jgi:radical SAM protein with 4Fe4S-binding SPASM domain